MSYYTKRCVIMKKKYIIFGLLIIALNLINYLGILLKTIIVLICKMKNFFFINSIGKAKFFTYRCKKYVL